LKRNYLFQQRKQRNLIAVDETVVKARKKKYYVYSAVDVERNELVLMRVYPTRNYLTTKSFVKEVLEYTVRISLNL